MAEGSGSAVGLEELGDDEMREQDRFLPIANVSRIMKRSLPANAKIAKDAKETVQECVSEFISFITSEASDKCQHEKRKTINGDDLLWAMSSLGFDKYVEPLKVYLNKYRESIKGEKPDKKMKREHQIMGMDEQNMAMMQQMQMQQMQAMQLQMMGGMQGMEGMQGMQGMQGMEAMQGMQGMAGMMGMAGMPTDHGAAAGLSAMAGMAAMSGMTDSASASASQGDTLQAMGTVGAQSMSPSMPQPVPPPVLGLETALTDARAAPAEG